MGDYPDEQMAREEYAGGLQETEASPESEKQRLLGLLLRPNNQYRLDQDFDYESDPRLNENGAEYQDFQDVLFDDWTDFVAQRAENDEERLLLESQNLLPLSREEIEQILDGRIEAASSEDEKNKLRGYKDRFLQRVDEYEQSLQAETEIQNLEISRNSRLYQEFAPDFADNKDGVQERYASLADYLQGCLKLVQSGQEPLPKGCNSADELLQPFWETEYLETKGGKKVSLGSLFALEHGASFYDNPESQMLHHVAKKHSGNRKMSLADTEAVSLRQLNRNFEVFLTGLANRLEAGELGLPEEAENMEDAFKALTEEEIEQWFIDNGLENSEFKKRFFGSFKKDPNPSGHPEDQGAEAGDFKGYQERLRARKLSNTEDSNDSPPGDSGDIDSNLPATSYLSPQEVFDKWKSEGAVAIKYVEVKAGERLLVKNPEFHIGTDGVVNVEYLSDDYFNGAFKEGKKYLSFKLPKEAILALNNNPETKNQIQDVITEIIQKNQGSPEPRFYSENGQLSLGIGDDIKRETLLRFDVGALRTAISKGYPDVAAKLSWYMTGKEKWLKRDLDANERQERRDEAGDLKKFERRELGKAVVILGDDAERLQISMHFWRKAFIESWKAKIGEAKYLELTQQAEAVPTNTAADTKPARSSKEKMQKPNAVITHERAKRTERKQEGQAFLNLIDSEFAGDYVAFLTSGKFWDLKTRSGLGAVEAMNVLADKILFQTGRATDYAEFQRFSRLSKYEQAEILKNSGMSYSIEASSSLLGARLRMFLTPSIESDGGARRHEDPGLREQRSQQSNPEPTTSRRDTQPARERAEKVSSAAQAASDRIQAQIENRINREYSEDTDLDLLLGHTKV